ncbi:uncharacterized protein B0H18DRAFT_960173 [Fomitopsis serialis]|uniref:uncharacterized protein n=1 Tax=Fomitopsis serialis TaxID=139415 RepID=UPI0020075773|nr:uncharacterized protein B0H18DRAFT_960173 [Neoantrodia serialis]KAH9913743.1 hypothetical protein B0H18DRAFT_960173 [Neoantrodia serialis]
MGPRNTRSSAAANKVKTPVASKAKTPAARKSAGAGVATKSSSSKADSGADAVPVLSYAARLKAMKESLRSLLPNLTAQELDAMARSNLAKGSKGISGEKEHQDVHNETQTCRCASQEQGDDGTGGDDDDAIAEEESKAGGSDEDELVIPSKSKGKNRRSPGKSTPITTPRKRKNVPSSSDNEDSDGESGSEKPEKKKTRTQRQDQLAEQATAAGNKRKIVEVAISSAPRTQAPKDEDDLAAHLGSRTVKAKKKAAPIVLGSEDEDELETSDKEGVPRRKETRSSKDEGKHVAKGNSSRREPSPMDVDDSQDGEGSSYKGSDGDGEDEDESADQLLSKDEEAPNEIIVKMEEESESKGRKRRQPRKKADSKKSEAGKNEPTAGAYEKLMEDVDVRSLLGKAQQELRVYLALENAWPRMKKGVSEKHAATANIYQREDFQKKFEPNWAFQKTKNKIIAYVNKAAPQLRQELKQKAKRVVEKEFLSIRLPEVGDDGKPVDAVERNQKVKKARENRIKFLKDNNTFHYGQLVLPDPEVDPSEPDLDMLFHGLCVAEVIANQWFRGQNPDVFRPACKERFDLGGALKIIPSNMIALACSAILVALDEWMNDNNTVEFQVKVYDRLLSGVEMIHWLANPNNKDYDEGWGKPLGVPERQVFAGLRVDSQSGQGEEKSNADLDPLINAGKVKARWQSRGGAPDNAQAGLSKCCVQG